MLAPGDHADPGKKSLGAPAQQKGTAHCGASPAVLQGALRSVLGRYLSRGCLQGMSS